MDELQYGDLVRSRDRRTGAEVFREVYLFGHRDAALAVPYVHLTAGGRTLVGSEGHFLPVCARRCTEADLQAGTIELENRRFRDVRAGDVLLISTGDSSFALAPVSAVDVLMARGAFNPYVRGADLVVDGVVASPHSDWILDWATPAPMVRHLPYVYEILLAPVYGLYRMVGPVTAEWLAHGLGLAESGAGESGLGYCVVLGADLVVDGVVASPHSDWILDWATPAPMVRHLPYVYEILLAPVYGLYRMVGPVTAEWLAHGLGLAESGAGESGLGYCVVLVGMAAPLAAALAAGRAASKQLLAGR
ncbi:hypothetical protein GPECTOR_555g573 [Gonium pectorale]|uniref:Hedgehog protein Hint domain-containing protein n=1 Tax=Gonium pectorale TaxID=33097 RepID=A0A150FWB1_GONPE|nr:hypothetical protein GPECTOR_555g573 [Gonium pectorale]|eukprot:KXZ41320.1 hypothetical protein GPECTOR_555g573 [Gonium pectorale]